MTYCKVCRHERVIYILTLCPRYVSSYSNLNKGTWLMRICMYVCKHLFPHVFSCLRVGERRTMTMCPKAKLGRCGA